MPSIMKKLLLEAFQLAGQALPTPPQDLRQKDMPPARPDSGARPIKKKSASGKRRHRQTPTTIRSPRQHHEQSLDTSCYGPGNTEKNSKETQGKNPASISDYALSLAADTRPLLASESAPLPHKMNRHNFNGCLTSMVDTGAYEDTLELKLGLDFGTSSTKIVIADPQQDKAFAVPFFDCTGISRYLFPGVIFKADHYNFDGDGDALCDLKLNLLSAEPKKQDLAQAVAFLALTIRHARSWLFTEHASLYLKSEILWTLNLGMPSDDANDPRLQPRFEQIGLAGWIASRLDKPLTDRVIECCLIDAQSILSAANSEPIIDIEIKVIPELAAQIHGHTSSESFDPRARNIFMIVDVGAGTVDSSLFHVYRDKKMSWNFEMYTKAVESNGSINLHRHRLNWWEKALLRFYPERVDLLKAIKNADSRSDCMTHIPDFFRNYFSKSSIHFDSPDIDPDTWFFKKRVKEQIFHKTYAAAKIQQHLQSDELKEMPTFLCGGGMLMPFYQQLNNELGKAHPNASWLKAKRMEMSQPRKMLAPSILTTDYHRLSVAYGLSMMRFGNLEQSMGAETPELSRKQDANRKTYVSKDMV